MFMNELIEEYKVATCHYTVVMSFNCIRFLSIIISDLQITTSKRVISIRYKLIMNVISMKYFYGYLRYVVHFAAF